MGLAVTFYKCTFSEQCLASVLTAAQSCGPAIIKRFPGLCQRGLSLNRRSSRNQLVHFLQPVLAAAKLHAAGALFGSWNSVCSETVLVGIGKETDLLLRGHRVVQLSRQWPGIVLRSALIEYYG